MSPAEQALWAWVVYRAAAGTAAAVALPLLARADRRNPRPWIGLGPLLGWVVSGPWGALLAYAVWIRASERGQDARRWTVATALLPAPGYLAYRAWDDGLRRGAVGGPGPALAALGGAVVTAGIVAAWFLVFHGRPGAAVLALVASAAVLLAGRRAYLRAAPPAARAATLDMARLVARARGEGFLEDAGGAIVSGIGLARAFPSRGLRDGRTLAAVAGVSLGLRAGETLALVGESGSGKTTLARMLLGLLRPDAGRVLYDGVPGDRLSRGEWRALRREIQVVFQDPVESLNPRMSVASLVGEPLVIHGLAEGRALRDATAELLGTVGLDPALGARYPRELSGGQRQRVAIARALAPGPRVLVCDEPVSALDVSVQAQVLNLLERLREERGLSMLLIAHDLSVVRHMSDRVAVMYLGRLVESGPAEAVFASPRHPYTRLLLDSVPRPAPRESPRVVPGGEPPSATDPPPGCAFHPRCSLAEEACRGALPPLEEKVPGHRAACIRSPAGGELPAGRGNGARETFSGSGP